jgi:hypothetical protein
MKDYVNDHLKAHPGETVRPGIMLKKGTLSVQASSAHYCSPRENDADNYSMVEVLPRGVGSTLPRSWKKYYDGAVYAWVPVRLVNRYLNKHKLEW